MSWRRKKREIERLKKGVLQETQQVQCLQQMETKDQQHQVQRNIQQQQLQIELKKGLNDQQQQCHTEQVLKEKSDTSNGHGEVTLDMDSPFDDDPERM